MMAIPFAIPEEDLNVLTARLIRLLEIHLERRLEENRDLQASMEVLVRLLFEERERRFRSDQYDNQLRLFLSLLPQTSNSNIFRPRSRSDCCEDPKLFNSIYSDSPDGGSHQVGLVLRKVADYDKAAIFKEESKKVAEEEEEQEDCAVETVAMFSRWVPVVGRTIWRAMPLICMVGWHLFQTNFNYCI